MRSSAVVRLGGDGGECLDYRIVGMIWGKCYCDKLNINIIVKNRK